MLNMIMDVPYSINENDVILKVIVIKKMLMYITHVLVQVLFIMSATCPVFHNYLTFPCMAD
jgi:hypothetical protein